MEIKTWIILITAIAAVVIGTCFYTYQPQSDTVKQTYEQSQQTENKVFIIEDIDGLSKEQITAEFNKQYPDWDILLITKDDKYYYIHAKKKVTK